MSGEHAVIVTILNDCFLEDLGSTNGTLVNGVLAKKHLLQNNDVIELGKYKLKFVGMASSPAPTPADYEKTMIWRPGGVKPRYSAAQAPSADGTAEGIRARPAFLLPGHSHAGARQGRLAPGPGDHSNPAPPPRRPRTTTGHLHGVIRFLSGARAGREMRLQKPLTTLGKPGTQVAVVTRRHEGFFIAHVEGATPTLVNGRPIGATPHPLKDRDTFELADVRMEFLLQEPAAEASSNRFWKIGAVLVGILVVVYVIYRVRG